MTAASRAFSPGLPASGSGVWERIRGLFANLADLTKFRLVSLVLLSTAVGFFLASSAPFPWIVFFHVLTGTGLVAAGSLALNQWIERDLDALMPRTASRPLPTNRMTPRQAFAVGLGMSVVGLVYLAVMSNYWAAALSGSTLVSYLLLYTPLKRITSFNTIVGAVPGAVPPMIGWAGVRGELSFEAWVLFSILFLWQLPHFLAIAWIYREQYRKAGFVMLSTQDPDGRRVARQAVLYAAMLVPVSLLPTLCGITGFFYFLAALVLGGAFLGISIAGLFNLDARARPIFVTSIVYLALLLIMMVIDKA